MTAQPLTLLSEEERLFKQTVLAFARERVAPKVAEMDRTMKIDRSLVSALFELGVMGVTVPAENGGAGSSIFNAILAVEALAVVDPSLSVFVDVQNTLVNSAVLRWGS